MKQVTPQDVAKLLDRNDYRVVMQKTDGGCITHFPKRTELPIPGFARLYQEFGEQGILMCTHDEAGTEVDTTNVLCPPYAHRLFTLYSVICHCMGIGYEIAFIKFVLDGREVNEEAFFQEHSSPFMEQKDTARENTLRNLIGVCFQQGFMQHHEEIAEQEGVREGFVSIRRLFVPDQMVGQLLELDEMLGDNEHE